MPSKPPSPATRIATGVDRHMQGKGGATRPFHSMSADDKPQRKVGIYDRPASADRKWKRWLPLLIAALASLAWIAYLLLAH